jgi:ribosome-binding protein aMBF1 (putative translation factor)
MSTLSNKIADARQLKSHVKSGAVPWHFKRMPAKKPPKPVNPMRAAFARRLEAARMTAGYETMRDFAAALGVEEGRYRRWEAAETEPDLLHLQKIARLTHISLDVLITGTHHKDAA